MNTTPKSRPNRWIAFIALHTDEITITFYRTEKIVLSLSLCVFVCENVHIEISAECLTFQSRSQLHAVYFELRLRFHCSMLRKYKCKSKKLVEASHLIVNSAQNRRRRSWIIFRMESNLKTFGFIFTHLLHCLSFFGAKHAVFLSFSLSSLEILVKLANRHSVRVERVLFAAPPTHGQKLKLAHFFS